MRAAFSGRHGLVVGEVARHPVQHRRCGERPVIRCSPVVNARSVRPGHQKQVLGRLVYKGDCRGVPAEVRAWLADNLVGDFAALKGLGGPGREHEAFEERLAWNRHLAAAGLTCLGWPVEHGGRGLSVAHRVAFYEEVREGRRTGQGQPSR